MTKGDSGMTVYERAFHDDYDISAWPLINGIHNERQGLRCHRAAHEYGATRKQKEHIATRLGQYRD